MSGADRPIGLALGGGGALGFAHVPILEVFDELGIRPAVISGCSMGAIIGAAYAAGRSGREIAGFLHGLPSLGGETSGFGGGAQPGGDVVAEQAVGGGVDQAFGHAYA